MTCFINTVALARCFGRRVSRAVLTAYIRENRWKRLAFGLHFLFTGLKPRC